MEERLLTPKNFTLDEYLNKGSYSVMPKSDVEKLREEFLSLSLCEQQKCLSILFAMQPYREALDIVMYITCGYRSKRHELSRGRSGYSQHTKFAIDITCNSLGELQELAKILDDTWFGGFSYYVDENFIHIDLGPKRRW